MGYTTLKAALDAVVKTNGRQQITGSNLNGVMTTILQGVDVLDRANPADTSGRNKVVLDKSKTFAQQVTGQNTIYEIRDQFNLGGSAVTIPANCELVFRGGQLVNGTLNGANTAIVADPVQIFNDTLSLGGTWVADEAFIQWFGGKCDGVTNDRSAFNLTLQYFKRIHLTNKVRIESSITLNNHHIINDAEICNTNPIEMQNNCIFEGGKVICESPYYAINVTGENSVVKDIQFSKSANYPVYNVDVFVCISHTAIGSKVENCVFGDNALYDIQVAGLKTCIDGCRFLEHVDNTTYGKAAAIKCSLDRTQSDADETATGASDLVIEKCIFEFHTDNAIDTFLAGKNVVIRDNVFEESKEGAIEFKVAYRQVNDQGTDYPSGRYSEGIIVANNHFKGYITIQTALLDGVYETIPKYMEYVKICGNRFDVNNHYAIILNYAMNVTIDGNLFKGAMASSEYGCIALQGDTDGTIISNNIVKLTGTNSIFLDVRPTNNEKCTIVRGNVISVETQNGVFRYSGQHLIVEDNRFDDCWFVVYASRGDIQHLFIRNNIVKNAHYLIANMAGTTQINDIIMDGNVFIDCISALKNDANKFPFVSMSENMVINTQDNSLGTCRLYYLPTGNLAIDGDYFHQGRNYLKLKDTAPEEYVRTFGSTSQRPTTARKFIQTGFLYYDKTLGKMIMWNGTSWVNPDGTALA